jgi:hypothetical protein
MNGFGRRIPARAGECADARGSDRRRRHDEARGLAVAGFGFHRDERAGEAQKSGGRLIAQPPAISQDQNALTQVS